MEKENEEDITSKKDDENTEEETEGETLEEETDVDALKEKNKQLFARAKKAEGFVLKDGEWVKKPEKSDTSKKPEAEKTSSNEEALTRDEAILIAGGVDEEDLIQLKAIQKGTGVSLSEAVKNPMYQAYQKEKKAETKRKKAQLGAGGGSSKTDDDINKQGLTEEEHRKLWSK